MSPPVSVPDNLTAVRTGFNGTVEQVKDWRFNGNEGQEEMELDLSGLNLSGGAYFLRAEIKGRAVHRKVVVR